MKNKIIGYIGAGNMARSLAGGMLANGWDRKKIFMSDPSDRQREGAQAALGIDVYAENRAVAEKADILVLAVKPQVLKQAAEGVREQVKARKPLVISVAAGVRIGDLDRWLGGDIAIVRVMPNTPALVGSGASGLFANEKVDTNQRSEAETVLRACGVAVWVKQESDLDIVTALSGSGPAYFFLVMEAMENAAVQLGLDRDNARLLALETAYGAAKMALEGQEEPVSLRQRVTSPGGTTERAIQVLEDYKIRQAFSDAMQAAVHRAEELAELFGSE